MKILRFGFGFLMPTILGKRHSGILKYHPSEHAVKTGEIASGWFRDGLSILLEITADPVVKPFKDLTKEEMNDSGYENHENALMHLKAEYPSGFDSEDTVAVIRYKVLEINGIPTILPNKVNLEISPKK